jgi:superfamily I DNA and RNA helicase
MPDRASAPAEAILLNGLTSQQKAVVRSAKRQVLVIAGAGSGKTEVMARRVAWWVSVLGIAKASIVAFTFTEKNRYRHSSSTSSVVGALRRL